MIVGINGIVPIFHDIHLADLLQITPGIFARENASSPFMMTCGIHQKMLRTHI
jgi:hypothetical protein